MSTQYQIYGIIDPLDTNLKVIAFLQPLQQPLQQPPQHLQQEPPQPQQLIVQVCSNNYIHFINEPILCT